MFIGKLISEAPIFPHNEPSIFHPWAINDRSFSTGAFIIDNLTDETTHLNEFYKDKPIILNQKRNRPIATKLTTAMIKYCSQIRLGSWYSICNLPSRQHWHWVRWSQQTAQCWLGSDIHLSRKQPSEQKISSTQKYKIPCCGSSQIVKLKMDCGFQLFPRFVQLYERTN